MTRDLHATTQQMLADIEKKDRRFRLAQSVFMALLIAALVGVIVVEIQILNGVRDQLRTAESTVQELKDNSERQNQRQIEHLQCIAKFFAQTPEERETSKIKTVDQCVLEDTNTGQQSFRPSGESSFLAPGRENRPQTINPNSSGLEPLSPRPDPEPEPAPRPSLVERVVNAVRGIIGL